MTTPALGRIHDRSRSLVFDAAPFVGLLLDEPGAPTTATLLTGRDVAISSVNFAEVADHVARRSGEPAEHVASVVRSTAVDLDVVAVTEAIAVAAASIRTEHYDRARCPISLADCVALALAASRSATVVTSDAALVDVARRRSIDVLPVPNSTGVTPP